MTAPSHDDDEHDAGLVDDSTIIEPEGDEDDARHRRKHDHPEEDPLGPPGALSDEDDFGLDGAENASNDDIESGDLDIGGIEIAIEEGPKGRKVGDEAGIAHDVDEFVPTFDDGVGHGGDEAGIELPGEDANEDLPWTADDGGAEGIGDGSEAEVDEAALPAMDGGAGGDFELNDLLEEMGFGGAEPWETIPQIGREDSLACVCARDGTLFAAGSAVVVVERAEMSTRVRPLAEPAHGCAIASGALLLATRRGVETIDASLAMAPRVLLARAEVSSIAIAAEKGWALAGSTLLAFDIGTGAHEAVRDDVLAMAAAQGTLFLATAAELGRLERRRGHDGAFERIEAEPATRRFLQRGGSIAACSPSSLVLLHEGRCLIVRVGGESKLLSRNDVVAATFRGESERADALVLAETPSGLEMVCVDANGVARSVVPVPQPAGPGPVGASYAIVWDPARELVVVAGPRGLVAMRPRLPH